MTKKDWFIYFLIPFMRSGAIYLRNRDANSTGLDDEAAAGIDYALTRIEKWIIGEEPAPPLES